MKKKVLLTTAIVFAISANVFASPQKLDYTQASNAAIDLGAVISPKIENNDLNSLGVKLDGKTSFYGAVTYTGEHQDAIQYKYTENKADGSVTYGGVTASADGNVKAQEVNFICKINENLLGFVGYTNNKVSIGSLNSTTNGAQIGVTGMTKLGKNANGWLTAAYGQKITSYEAGVGVSLNKNTELNLVYNDTKYRNFEYSSEKFNVEAKGARVGLTFAL